jgi:hypothetical protein
VRKDARDGSGQGQGTTRLRESEMYHERPGTRTSKFRANIILVFDRFEFKDGLMKKQTFLSPQRCVSSTPVLQIDIHTHIRAASRK